MANPSVQTIQTIDSHTAGEPTRVVTSGGPDLGGGSVADQLECLRRDFDHIRSAIVNEPRGSDTMVGALPCLSPNPSCATGVIFFNNVGFLGMCGHGVIGLAVTLYHLGRIGLGQSKIDTPVGVVEINLESSNTVAVSNVPSYLFAKDIEVNVEGHGVVRGDVAWGGNWFYLIEDHGKDLVFSDADHLTDFAWRVREALRRENITGRDGQEIDHIELFGPPQRSDADSRNFVLCPGKAYDRSPCGTGTSAKLASLYERGKLREGQVWRQESIIGSLFAGWVTCHSGIIKPTIQGGAYIVAESTLQFQDDDPFRWGIT